MSEMHLPIRYVKLYPDAGKELDESSFEHHEAVLSYPMEQSALVLVDFWNLMWGPEPIVPELGWEAECNAGYSFCRRVKETALDAAVPALKAAREAGMVVIHAPTRDIAEKYPQYHAAARIGKKPAPPAQGALSEKEEPWPPPEFVRDWRNLKRDRFRTQRWSENYYGRVRPLQDIPEPVKPLPDELVIGSGDQMHAVLRERAIRYLIYMGYATNMCLLFKLGAMDEMNRRGYLTVLLRDATAAVETAETVSGLWMTRAFIEWIELTYGYTSTTPAFIEALRGTEEA
jgi:nicotinamidase-related amidase